MNEATGGDRNIDEKKHRERDGETVGTGKKKRKDGRCAEKKRSKIK